MIGIVLYIDLDKYGNVDKCKRWTREIVDIAAEMGGKFYLPYHIWYTKEQFRRCYKRYNMFIKMKYEIDPELKFTSHLWEHIM